MDDPVHVRGVVLLILEDNTHIFHDIDRCLDLTLGPREAVVLVPSEATPLEHIEIDRSTLEREIEKGGWSGR